MQGLVIDGEMEYLGTLRRREKSPGRGNTCIPAAWSTLRIIVNQIFILCDLQFSQSICVVFPPMFPV